MKRPNKTEMPPKVKATGKPNSISKNMITNNNIAKKAANDLWFYRMIKNFEK